jgi:hypothetical protein
MVSSTSMGVWRLWARAGRVGSFALAVGVVCGGCALLVGDPDGHRLFTAPPDASLEGAAGDGDTSDGTLNVDGADAGGLEAGDGAQAVDAGSLDATADGRPVDAAPDSASPGVRCSHQFCPAGTICCNSNPFDPVNGGACVAASQCFAPSTAFYCSSQRDCVAQGFPTDYCCAGTHYVQTDAGTFNEISGAQCSPTCGGPFTQVLCDPSDQAQCRAIDAGCKTLFVPPDNYFACQ